MPAPDDRTFCCVSCRLLQAAGSDCIECGAEIGWIEVEGELLRFRPARGTGRNDWVPFAAATTIVASIGAFLAGGLVSLWVPLVYFSGLSGVGAVAAHAARQRKTITGLPDRAHLEARGAKGWSGVAHAIAGRTLATVTGDHALVEHLTLRDHRGALLLRRINALPFALELPSGVRLVVAGEVRVIGRGARGDTITGDDPRVARMGIPAEMIRRARLESGVVREGDPVTVRGLSAGELVPELAFHRDGGQTEVVRGRRGALVTIEPAAG